MPTIRLDGMLPFVIVAREHARTNRTRKVILHLTTGTLTVSASAPYVGWPPTLWSRRLSEACVFLHCISSCLMQTRTLSRSKVINSFVRTRAIF